MKEHEFTLVREGETIAITDGNDTPIVIFEAMQTGVTPVRIKVIDYGDEYIVFHRDFYQRILDELRKSETN